MFEQRSELANPHTSIDPNVSLMSISHLFRQRIDEVTIGLEDQRRRQFLTFFGQGIFRPVQQPMPGVVKI